MSTFGTWFGISVLALNPFGLKKKKKKDKSGKEKSDDVYNLVSKLKTDQNVDKLQQLINTLKGRVGKLEQSFGTRLSIVESANRHFTP